MNESSSNTQGGDLTQPLTQLVHAPLADFQSTFQAVLQDITSATSGRTGSKTTAQVSESVQQLILAYSKVKRSVSLVKRHQEFQTKIADVKKDIHQVEQEILRVNKRLRTHENDLENLVYDARQQIKAERFKQLKTLAPDVVGDDSGENDHPPQLNLKALIEYARNLSYSTSAPRGWHFSQAREIPLPFKPPAPQSENMKMGLLFTAPKELLRLMKMSHLNKQNAEQQADKKDDAGDANPPSQADPATSAATEEVGDKRKEQPSQPQRPSLKRQRSNSDQQPKFDLGLSSGSDSE